MSPVQLPLRPSPWVETFCIFCFFWFSRGFFNKAALLRQNIDDAWKRSRFNPS